MNPDEIDTQTLLMLLAGRLHDSVQTHPWATLAGAAGAGYVLGAGLPNLVVRLSSAAALRAATNYAVQRLMGGGDLSGAEGESVDADPITVEPNSKRSETGTKSGSSRRKAAGVDG